MISLKEVEKLMKSAFTSNDPALAVAFNEMLKIFRYKDFEESTNHCETIILLYKSKNKKYTLAGIAQLTNKCDKTLKRHREHYAQCFYYHFLIEKLKTEAEAETAITEFKNGLTANRKPRNKA
ncbi:MAG: hypothetical protein HDQ88_06490 [Clostridia bacterium]|nr:hypothetical protein [Clostridia bacterium]